MSLAACEQSDPGAAEQLAAQRPYGGLPPRTDQGFGALNGAPASTGVAPVGVAISLDTSAVKDQLQPPARLFVFLRVPGEPMPLAVQQFSAKEIPTSVTFPVTAPVDRVEAVARFSFSGQVERDSSDIEVTAMVAPGHPPTPTILKLSADSFTETSAATAAVPLPAPPTLMNRN